MTDSLVPVRIGVCLCPGAPHADGDFVYLRPILDLRGGFRVKRAILDVNRAEATRQVKASSKAGSSIKQLAVQYDVTAAEIEEVLARVDDLAEAEISLAEAYLDEGVADWNLLDPDGDQRPVTPDTLREFLSYDYGRVEPIVSEADQMYKAAVIDPLLQRVLSSLPPMPTNGSTSRTKTNGSKSRPTKKPSSTTTSPMVATEATT